MFLCVVALRPRRAARAKLQDSVPLLLGAWGRNGQLWGEPVTGWRGNRLEVHCSIPRRDSLDGRHGSAEVRSARERVLGLCRGEPAVAIVGPGVLARAARFRRAGSLYLFTHLFDETSPLCDGETGGPVPLYEVPIDERRRAELATWMATYRAVDRLWIGSGALEMEAYRQLATVDSTLSVAGRRLAAQIEEATKRPTYYFLMRYWGRRAAGTRIGPSKLERDRPCPGCGRRWRRRSVRAGRGLTWFDFRCDRCRLVSLQAASFDDDRRARIGEWPGRVRHPRGSRRAPVFDAKRDPG